jgi:hypothetical protein
MGKFTDVFSNPMSEIGHFMHEFHTIFFLRQLEMQSASQHKSENLTFLKQRNQTTNRIKFMELKTVSFQILGAKMKFYVLRLVVWLPIDFVSTGCY